MEYVFPLPDAPNATTALLWPSIAFATTGCPMAS
jgi:hypothetical protein